MVYDSSMSIEGTDVHFDSFVANKGAGGRAVRASLKNFKIQNPGVAGQDTVGLNNYGTTWLIEDGEVYNNMGSAVLFGEDGKDHIMRKVIMRNSGGGPTYGTHGLYDKSPGTLVEDCDSSTISNGSAYSPRYPNRYLRCASHDTGPSYGIFDYSVDGTDGHGCSTVRIREARAWNLHSWFVYLGPEYHGTAGVSNFGIEIDHATLDLRGCGRGPLAFQEVHKDVYVTNSLIIWDGTAADLVLQPKAGFQVHMDGTIVIGSGQIPQYFESQAPTFKLAANSPAIGKAVSSPPETRKMWADLLSVGAYQTAVPQPTIPPGLTSAKVALYELRASTSYKTLKTKSYWMTTHIYNCEVKLLNTIKELGG